jgi:putative oxidoreductase
VNAVAERWRALAPWMQGVLRIAAAASFWLHGSAKLFAFPPSPNPRREIELFSQIGLAGILEVVGGGMMLLGIFTRPVAFLLSGEMAVAYFQSHFPRGLYTTQNGGEAAYLFCFIWLFYSAAGAGRLSIDHLLSAQRSGQRRNSAGRTQP